MKLIYNTLEVVNWAKEHADFTVGFVPTMGALHQGHLSLIDQAKKRVDKVVVSIFVNPKQFDSNSDFQTYPLNLDNDLELLKNNAVDLVFHPLSAEELYRHEDFSTFSFDGIDQVMEGIHRTNHFTGVARVVKLFFDLIQPDLAFFGEKDYQQLLIIKKMISVLGLKTQVVACPTVRENSGLAMSSRNTRLTAQEKELAANIFKTLNFCKKKLSLSSIEELEKECFAQLASFSIPEYFEIRNANDLTKNGNNQAKWRAFTATKLGNVRLIDNIALN